MTGAEQIAQALRETLCSPNVADSNWEAANVVDALDSIARAGFAVARAINRAAGYDPDDLEAGPRTTRATQDAWGGAT